MLSNNLSPEEKFADRLEITGYFTAGMAGILLLVYFSMIFFYQPVQTHSLGTKALVLLTSIFLLCAGLFIPRENNLARIGFCLFFYCFAVFSYFRAVPRGEWYYFFGLLYAVYVLWVLTHPMAIRVFRKLRPYEERQIPAANWFVLQRVLLFLYALIIGWHGLFILTEPELDYMYDTDLGTLYVFLSLVLLFFLIFFRRLQNWARWCVILFCLALGVTAIPATINPQVQNYLEYWKSLLKVFYFLGVAAYLIFSPAIKSIFIKPPIPITPAKTST
ncbi:hypothetical protein KAR34_14160 [bacterium]|nr:hypothetical protein [bacterium]